MATEDKSPPSSNSVECVVIGAGVIGLAVARALAVSGREVLLLEAEDAIGTQTSSRNSEVIHAGIYYPSDSNKAALCLPGKQMLYEYCRSRGVHYQQCGKLIVATSPGQTEGLQQIYAAGLKNGVNDLAMITAAEAQQRAPGIAADAAIWSPSTGIVDSHALMLALLGDFENAGGTLALKSKIQSISVLKTGLRICLASDGDFELNANMVINSAGLGAIPLAKLIDGLSSKYIPSIEFAKGSYFSYSGAHPFDCLIYPMPTPGGLGTHLTLDQAGQARFGPDVEWVSKEDYSVSEAKLEGFYQAVRDFWPDVKKTALSPAYAGIRAKCMPQGKGYHDFIFSGPAQHGIKGLINLFGMESPGLTSCLAIADHVVGKCSQANI